MEKEKLYRFVGNTDQLYGVKKMTISEGPAGGSKIYTVKTGGGLHFHVHLDTGFDIGELSYKGNNISFLSKNGMHSPYNTYPFEDDFLNSFPGGILYTCGLLSVGPGNREDGKWHPLHGRFHSIPAEGCSVSVTSECITLSAKIRETELFGHCLEVRRTIVCPSFGSTVTVTDEITNLTPEPVDFMLLYHLNFGYPFLSKDLTLRLPDGTKTTPRNEVSAKGLDRHCEFTDPIDGFMEEVFFHDLPGGKPTLTLQNSALKIGAKVAMSHDTLPVLAEWKCMRSGDYALGIEPSNCFIMGRKGEKENGTIKTIEPFGTVKAEVVLDFYML